MSKLENMDSQSVVGNEDLDFVNKNTEKSRQLDMDASSKSTVK